MATATARRPRMSADEATTFEQGESARQYGAVKEALLERGCTSCEPYADVFTLPRWNAQGYRIRKGERSIRVSTYIPIEEKDDSGNVIGTRRRPWTTFLFCRCQVERKG